jgi:hypothetical protein
LQKLAQAETLIMHQKCCGCRRRCRTCAVVLSRM